MLVYRRINLLLGWFLLYIPRHPSNISACSIEVILEINGQKLAGLSEAEMVSTSGPTLLIQKNIEMAENQR